MKSFFITLIGLLFVSLHVAALEVPMLVSRVNDLAHLLDEGTKQEIENQLQDFETRTTNQIAILTIPSLEGLVLEDYSLKVAQTWRLGQAAKDNGVLLLIARDDRKMRIEVGYGLEGALTDALASQIIRNDITPQFKNGDFNAGIQNGVAAILQALEGTYVANESGEDIEGKIAASLIFLFVVGIFTLIGLTSKGAASWVMYVFLMVFWLAFPFGILGPIGIFVSLFYIIGYPILRKFLPETSFGRSTYTFFQSGSGSGSSSSSSGSFSGGGGSFGGGGSSGSW